MDKKEKPPNTDKKPNEVGSIQVSSHLKIYDPKTKEIIVEKKT